MNNVNINVTQVVNFILDPEESLTGNESNAAVTDLKNLYKETVSKFNFADSSLGGNDAMNPYWSFNEDDDIIPPLHDYTGTGMYGMGRVYKEMYEDNQQILWLRFGVPEYVGLKKFFFGATDPGLTELMNKGESVAMVLGDLFGKCIGFAFKIPFLPLVWLVDKISNVDTVNLNRFYGFKPCMHIYYRMVNVMIAHLAVNMGLFPGYVTVKGVEKESGGVDEGQLTELYAEAGLPAILKDGPDIFTILDRRARRSNPSKGIQRADQFIPSKDDRSPFEKTMFSADETKRGASDFIGFRIEKSVDSSESVSNSTMESSISQKLNGTSSEMRQKMYSAGGGVTGVGVIDDSIKFVTQAFKSAAATIGLGDLLNSVTGAGYYDIGEVWANSSFQKSYSFNMQLNARYGDPVSIFQACYIPLVMLMVGGCPRSIGSNMFTSPFLVNAYCKGMFSVPCGIIENLTVRRGLPEYGWTYNQLPTAITINFSIKDLCPTMHFTLGDTGFLDILKKNDNMQDYLTTLAGIGLVDKISIIRTKERKMNIALMVKKNTFGNSLAYGNYIGNTKIARVVSLFQPFSASLSRK